MSRPLPLLIAILALLASPLNSAAQIVSEGLCDTQFSSQVVGGVQVPDCRTPIINLIRNEKQGIDVAFWVMEDARYANELINWHRNNPSLPIRVLVDERANNSKPVNAQMLASLRDAGIPMREKIPDPSYNIQILHFKMMLFHGQNVVEFSKANYSPGEFVPISSTDFFDEAIFFTNDDRLTNSFRRRFDDLWVNTSVYQDYANITGPLTRQYPLYTIDPAMNFVPLQDFANRAKGRINAEPAGGQMDAIVFRVTDHLLPDAVISAIGRGVTVRLITDASEYRNEDRLWDAAHIDRMWINGAQIRIGNHGGNVHEASIVLHSLGEVIFGSSNWTTPSAIKQDEHNFFYSPGFGKPWFYQWFEDQFARKWNDSTNFPVFKPLPPTSPAYASPLNGASGQSPTSVTLKWEGGPWAHFYDIYFGTSSNPPLLVSNQQIGSPDPGVGEKYTVSNLQPGTTYYWRIVSKTWAQITNSGPVWSFTTSGTPPSGGGSTPFGGTPAAIPGTVQAENFDDGGQNVAYYDVTSGNSGGVYRTTDVDVQTTSDAGGGYNVGWTRAGEWLNYTITIGTSGTYQLQTRVANTASGGAFRVEVDGVDKTGSIAVPNTGGYQAWQTITTSGLSLTAGQHLMRVVFTTASGNGGVGNFNWFRLDTSSGSPSNTPFGGTPWPIPGTLQAENFDLGGQNVAWYDTTSGNSLGAYRSTDVDIEATTDSGGGYDVGKTRAGEWLKYTVNIASGGTYQLAVRIANVGTGGRFRVEVDGVDKTGPIAVPDTGGWQSWETLTVSGISLSSGQHVVRLVLVTAGTSGGVGNYNWLQFTSQ
jgi:hypothetical protein